MKASEAVGRNPGAATPILIQALISSALAEAIVFLRDLHGPLVRPARGPPFARPRCLLLPFLLYLDEFAHNSRAGQSFSRPTSTW